MISVKAIRFRHPDYDPDRAQKLISSSMSRHLSTRNISFKSMQAFLSNLANRQTDRQTDRQTNKHGQKHVPPPLLEVTTSFQLLHLQEDIRDLQLHSTERNNISTTLVKSTSMTTNWVGHRQEEDTCVLQRQRVSLLYRRKETTSPTMLVQFPRQI